MILGSIILYVMLGAYTMALIMHSVAVKSDKSYSELFLVKKVLLLGLIWPVVLIRAVAMGAYRVALVALAAALSTGAHSGVSYEVFLEYADRRESVNGEYEIVNRQ